MFLHYVSRGADIRPGEKLRISTERILAARSNAERISDLECATGRSGVFRVCVWRSGAERSGAIRRENCYKSHGVIMRSVYPSFLECATGRSGVFRVCVWRSGAELSAATNLTDYYGAEYPSHVCFAKRFILLRQQTAHNRGISPRWTVANISIRKMTRLTAEEVGRPRVSTMKPVSSKGKNGKKNIKKSRTSLQKKENNKKQE